MILETEVGCVRVRCERRVWQGVTTQRAIARKKEQRCQARRAWCNRVHSVFTQMVTTGEGKKVNVRRAFEMFKSDQLRVPG